LLARRKEHQHQGNLWEFPGGKIEPGETLAAALVREFQEEVNLHLVLNEAIEPWLVIDHDYGDKQVRLEVARVEQFTGKPDGREGQTVEWVALEDLAGRAFPAANEPILAALTSVSTTPR
ncbi:MAG: NUDIX domain-containing protein, partial [Natronospirillum sp.]